MRTQTWHVDTGQWNPDLQKAHDRLNSARDDAEKNPGEENHIKLQRCKAEYIRKNLESKRKSWRETTENLNMEKDTTKLWRLVKALNNEGGGYQPISLEKDGEVLNEKRAANAFGKAFEEEMMLEERHKKRGTQNTTKIYQM